MTLRPQEHRKAVSVGREGIAHNARHKQRRLLIAFVAALLIAPGGVLSLAYMGISLFIALIVALARPKAITRTPAELGLNYRDVSFAVLVGYALSGERTLDWISWKQAALEMAREEVAPLR